MRNRYIILFIAALLFTCKKPYDPKIAGSSDGYLVVEGVINIADTTTIKLSKTVMLSSATTSNPLSGAGVQVEDDKGGIYPLNESFIPGSYKLGGVTLAQSNKYRLRIRTNGKEYLSNYESAMVTPPIDSVGYKVASNGLSLYVNTHDPKNNTRYYRFDYAETWKFHSNYNSSFMSDGTQIVARPADQQIYYCFAGDISSTIVLGSTAKLSQDVLYQQPLTQIVNTSEKLEIKYSILVKEYALSPDAYKFWTNLKKNTEDLGSIFDAQPSQIKGNIYNVNDAAEPVVGFISVGTITQKRIFISNEQLPQNFIGRSPFDCEVDTEYFDNPHTHANDVARILIPGVLIPLYSIKYPPVAYTASTRDCVDCTTRGYTKQPSFWQ